MTDHQAPPGASESNNGGAAPPAEPAVSHWLVLGCVALAGAGTMIVELGAVRLLAPWFGTSSFVWTDVIGVILAALALGYWIGARLARRPGSVRRLALTLMVGAALVAWLPFGADTVASWLMPAEGVRLGAAAGILTWGSLAASAILFLPAATVLGTAGPLAVEAIQRLRGGAAGDAGGRVLACSTLGSIAGTFGTTHALVPWLGPGGAMLVAAGGLAFAGAVLALAGRGPGPLAAVALLVAAGGGTSHGLGEGAPRAARALGPGEQLIASVESKLQSLSVIERVGPNGEPLLRQLKVNEGLDSFQSVWTPKRGLLPQGHYYNLFALPLALQTRMGGLAPERWRTYILGVGAGTAMRVMEGTVDSAATALEFVGTEIDPAVLTLGKAHFELGSTSHSTSTLVGGLDGRAGLRCATGTFDQVIVDAYSNNMEIPPHLVTVEAFAEMRARLKDGGWLTVNVGGFSADDPVVRSVARTVARAFDGEAVLARVPFSRNWVVFARKDAAVPEPGSTAFGSRGAPLPFGLAELSDLLRVPGSWVEIQGSDGPVLRDRHSPTESLQLASIAAARASLVRFDRGGARWSSAPGDTGPSGQDLELQAEARRLIEDKDLEPALEAAQSIRSTSVRGALEAEILWRAGAPLKGLEAAMGALEAGGGASPELLRLAADLAFAVGATRFAYSAFSDLRTALGPEPGEWWAAELERLRTLGDRARTVREARAAGERRALASLAVIGLIALGLVLASRRL